MNPIAVTKSRKTAVPSVRALAITAMLAAISYVLAFLEFPVPLSPSFARMDLSDFPALVGAFAYGPLRGLTVEFVKNAMQLFSSSAGGVGELANFLMGASFVATEGFLYIPGPQLGRDKGRHIGTAVGDNFQIDFRVLFL